ncbi:MAG: hypothetical protein D6820_05425, partial [Lentisphaerae bacterium]
RYLIDFQVPCNPEAPVLFCFHGGFDISVYHDLAHAVAPHLHVVGVQYPLSAPRPIAIDFSALTELYLDEILQLYPRAPYHFAGSSVAGYLAVEAARQLHCRKIPVGIVALFDSYGPGLDKEIILHHHVPLFARIHHHWEKLKHTPGRRRQYLVNKTRQLYHQLSDWLQYHLSGKIDMPPWAETFWNAFAGYTPLPYSGTVHLFRAQNSPSTKIEDTLGWKFYAKTIRVIRIPGIHGAIITQPHVKHLARHLVRLIPS